MIVPESLRRGSIRQDERNPSILEGPDAESVQQSSDPSTMAIDPDVGSTSYAEEVAVEVAESSVSYILYRVPPDVILALTYLEIAAGASVDLL